MAERRMFHKTVLSSNAFTMLSHQLQVLYIHLNLMADDDGVCVNSHAVCRTCRCTKRHLQQLIQDGWLLEFPDGVVVITHWHIHNQIRKDRYKPSLCRQVTQQLQKGPDGAYERLPDGCQFGNQMATQGRVNQDSIVQDSINQDSIGEDSVGEVACATQASTPAPPQAAEDHDYEKVLYHYQLICPDLEPCEKMTPWLKEKVDGCYAEGYTATRMAGIFMKANYSAFLRGKNAKNWRASLGWLLDTAHLRQVENGKFDNWT